MSNATTASISIELIKAVQDLSLAKDVSDVTSIVKKATRKIAQSDGVTIVLKEEGKCYYIDEDAIMPLWKGMKFPLEKCISGWCMIHKEQVWIEDIYEDDRIPLDAYSPTFVKSLSMTPIRTDSPIGSIGSYWSETYKPSEAEMEGMQALANATSNAFERLKYLELLENKYNELEQYSHQLSRLTWVAYHNLNEPVREVSLNCELLKSIFQNDINLEQELLLERVENSLKKVKHLVDDLQEVSSSTNYQLNIGSIDLNIIVKDVQKEFTHLIRMTKAKVICEDLPEVEADPILLVSVLKNLFSNSLKFARQDVDPVIKISALPTDSKWIISFEDNGCGIPEKYKDNIFKFFTRFTENHNIPGNGVGLALCKKNMKSMGGDIKYEPSDVTGSIFKLYLPRKI